jgi:flagellar protein FliS
MSFAGRGLDSYRQTQAQSRTPLELVVMLYDGALTFLAVARDAIERRDIAARRKALSNALAIISELQSTLKIEEGGELAASLDELYGYASRRLLEAAAKNDVTPLDEVRKVFEILREAWSSIATPAAAGSRP